MVTQEEKDLLLKDLCARLPYGVKISIPELWISEKKVEVLNEIFKGDDGLYRVNDNGMIIEYVKPYLFPLSSMTEEQRKEMHNYSTVVWDNSIDSTSYEDRKIYCASLEIEWLDKNHFDHRGLIPLGLAIDATELNIY